MLIVIIALIVILVIADAIGSGGSTSAIIPGMRAVVVPTADAARTVVIPPCATGAPATSAKAGASLNTAGTVAVQLPQGQGTRVVLVPKCSTTQGGIAPTNALPSAAFVTTPGTALPPIGTARSTSSSSSITAAPGSAQFQLSVPVGSPIRMIVVPPCERTHGTGPAAQLLAPPPGSTTAVAPSC